MLAVGKSIKDNKTIMIVAVVVVGLVGGLLMAFSWLNRSTRTVSAAVFSGGGDLYVVEESFAEDARFHLVRYEREDSFETAEETSLSALPGCDQDDSVIVEDLQYSVSGVAVLGGCDWSAESYYLWEYNETSDEFHMVFQGTGDYPEEMIPMENGQVGEFYYTDVPGDDRFCDVLHHHVDDADQVVALQEYLDIEGVGSGSCSVGIWEVSVDSTGGLVMYVKARDSDRSFICRMGDADSDVECIELNRRSYDDCRFRPNSSAYLCYTREDEGYLADLFEIGEGTIPVTADVSVEKKGFLLLDLEGVMVVVNAGQVEWTNA